MKTKLSVVLFLILTTMAYYANVFAEYTNANQAPEQSLALNDNVSNPENVSNNDDNDSDEGSPDVATGDDDY